MTGRMSEDYYNKHGASYFAETVALDVSSLRDRFSVRLAPGAAVCDAGCGSGRDAKAFLAQGFSVTAFDASPTLASLAREHSGVDVTRLRFQDLAFYEAFDGIWSCASLLHVRIADEVDVLSRLVRALRSSGVWFLGYKVGVGEEAVGERFFRYHTEGSLRAVLAALDVEVDELWQTPDLRPDHHESWINCLARKK